MKLIASLAGTVALNVQADDVAPKNGLTQRDLAQYISDRYQFSGRPNVSNTLASPTVLIFNQGKMVSKSGEYPILQIAQPPNGDIVTAINTDIAELVLDDLIAGLEADLKFDYRGKAQQRTYLSILTVECDEPVEKLFTALQTVEELLNQAIPRDGWPFRFKGFTLGYGESSDAPTFDDISSLRKADFQFQRRAGVPYDQNRYYSSMPVPTKRHFEILQQIEKALRA
jgi:hypothetical protein